MLVPALINFCFVAVARWLHPYPEDVEPPASKSADTGMPRVY